MDDRWLALNIGNSRLHWALFENDDLQQTWNTPHLSESNVQALITNHFNFTATQISLPNTLFLIGHPQPELWIASVVSAQTKLWQAYSSAQWIDLNRIPLHQVYPSLGIDRALALWGAIQTYGCPALVIDCGTAMTFTGADSDFNLIGGAILPGFQLQFQALGQGTAALPLLKPESLSDLPNRWARNTISAIQSGILYTVLAGIRDFVEDWREKFPTSEIVLTGGDAPLVYSAFQHTKPDFGEKLQLDLNLAFWGIRSMRKGLGVRD